MFWEVKRLKVSRKIEGMRSEIVMPLYIETSLISKNPKVYQKIPKVRSEI